MLHSKIEDAGKSSTNGAADYPPLGSAGMAERWPPSLDGSRPTTRGALASRPKNQLLAVFLVASDFAAALTLRVLVEIRFVVVCERCMSLKTKRDAISKFSKTLLTEQFLQKKNGIGSPLRYVVLCAGASEEDRLTTPSKVRKKSSRTPPQDGEVRECARFLFCEFSCSTQLTNYFQQRPLISSHQTK